MFIDAIKNESLPVTQRLLVDFGNYLFERYKVEVFSSDGQNVPIYTRQVSDADLANWVVGQELSNTLPSAHQIGDTVSLCFGDTGTLSGCRVIKVHFSQSKVLYDIEVRGTHQQTADHPAGTWTTRLYNVDSVFVTKPQV